MTLLAIRDLKVHFGGVRAVDGVSLDIREGGVRALIGPNGAGKTTLINAVTGVYRPTAGQVMIGARDITGMSAERLAIHRVTRTFQNLQVFWTMTVLENVLAGFHLAHYRGFFRGLLRPPGLVRRERALEEKARSLLDSVGLASRARDMASALPYGELKRLEIARALATDPKLLFLDEPVAGCTPTEKRALAAVIRRVADESGATIVLVEHDMRLVTSISDHVTVLVRGRMLAEGAPSDVMRDARVVEAYLGVRPPVEERRYAAAS